MIIRHLVVEKGVTLVEVLVALLVLGVGVMGFAALQLRSVETTSVTYSRTQAMAIARDIVERINTNPSGWPDSYADAGDNWTRAISETANPCVLAPGGELPNCTIQEMAAADINDVRRVATDMLFGGNVLVQQNCRDGAVVACAIVAWAGANPATCDPEAVTLEDSIEADASVNDQGANRTANCVIVEFWPQRALIAAAGAEGE